MFIISSGQDLFVQPVQTPTSLYRYLIIRCLSGNEGKGKLQQRMCTMICTGVLFFLCSELISFSLATSKSIIYPASQCCHIIDGFWLGLPSWTPFALLPDSHISQLFPNWWNCCPYCREGLNWRETHKVAVPFLRHKHKFGTRGIKFLIFMQNEPRRLYLNSEFCHETHILGFPWKTLGKQWLSSVLNQLESSTKTELFCLMRKDSFSQG